MTTCDNSLLTIITTISGVLLLISEFLPYASSSKCNSIMEGISHIVCKNNCLKSNKQIIYDNHELCKEVVQLKKEISNLTKVRRSLDIHNMATDIENQVH